MRKLALGLVVGAALAQPALAGDKPPAQVKPARAQGGAARAMNKTDGKVNALKFHEDKFHQGAPAQGAERMAPKKGGG